MNDSEKHGLRAVLYARKSNESIDKQVQSIDDQIDAMQKIARDEGIKIIDILKESKSAKAPGARPIFKQMMRDIEDGKYKNRLQCLFLLGLRNQFEKNNRKKR